MVKNAGSKNKRGRLMKNMKLPNSGLTAIRIECAFGQSTSIGGLKPV